MDVTLDAVNQTLTDAIANSPNVCENYTAVLAGLAAALAVVSELLPYSKCDGNGICHLLYRRVAAHLQARRDSAAQSDLPL
jgi:hypothetical protein